MQQLHRRTTTTMEPAGTHSAGTQSFALAGSAAKNFNYEGATRVNYLQGALAPLSIVIRAHPPFWASNE